MKNSPYSSSDDDEEYTSDDDEESIPDDGHADDQYCKVEAVDEQVDYCSVKSLQNTTCPIVLYSDSSDDDFY